MPQASEQPANPNESGAMAWLRNQFEYIACDATHYVYGVGYIDGSYMEKVFLVADEQGGPRVEAGFRPGSSAWHAEDGDLEARAFMVEATVPRAIYAEKSGSGWRVSDEGWETALRFKYTSWFGMLSRVDGQWQAEWQGYRRPMLPADLPGNGQNVCAWFDVN